MFPWSQPSQSTPTKHTGLKIVNYDPDAPPSDPSAQCYALRGSILHDPKVTFLFHHILRLNNNNQNTSGSTPSNPSMHDLSSKHNAAASGQADVPQLALNQLIQCITGCPKYTNAMSLTTYDPNLPTHQAMVGICQSPRLNPEKITIDVTHELVHLYDQLRVDFDPNDCFQTLCTETRASMLSGECAPSTTSSLSAILGSPSKSSFPASTHSSHLVDLSIEPNGFQKCVEMNAMRSTRKFRQCDDFFQQHTDPEQLKNLSWVVSTCMKDTAPFPAIP